VKLYKTQTQTPLKFLLELLGEVEEKFDLSKVAKGLDEDTQAIYDKLNGNFEYDFASD
jgi:hypothetical protein